MDLHTDLDFECIREDILPVQLETVGKKDDHVGKVKRSIQTAKGTARTTVGGLPFKRWPRQMIIELVAACMRFLNQIPSNNGVSDRLSPLTIVTGGGRIDFNTLKLEFGSFVHAFEDNDPTNTNKSRSVEAIVLSITTNRSGFYCFLSLRTGKIIRRKQYRVLPMTELVIRRVHELAKLEGQPLIRNGCPNFKWGPDDPIDDREDEESVFGVEDIDGDASSIDSGAIPDDDDDMDEDDNDDGSHNNDDNNSKIEGAPADGSDNRNDDFEPDDLSNDEHEQRSAGNSSDHDDDTGSDTGTEEVSEEPDPREGTESVSSDNESEGTRNREPTHQYNLRNNTRSYAHRLDRKMDLVTGTSKTYESSFLQKAADVSYKMEQQRDDKVYSAQFLMNAMEKASNDATEDLYEYVCSFLFNQMSAKKGIEKFGEVAIEALLTEFAQLEDLSTFRGVNASDLTREQKKEALPAINLIKEKRSGKIKGRMVANGSVQRKTFVKEESTSATVSNDALIMSIVIDANEGRCVGTGDVPGAYLHADMNDFPLLKLAGESVEIMCRMNPEYEKFVTFDKGKKILYLQLMKALYRCIKSTMLWYNLFADTLQKDGFEINPYNFCVANKMVNGKQCTIVWYVDDLKVSHMERSVVESVMKQIEDRFGDLRATIGDSHDYLGMHIKYTKKGTAEIRMKDHIKEAIEASGEDVSGRAATPARKNLFDIDEDSKALDNKKHDLFHHIVAKLLYVSKRCRLDIQLAISFLCTRVSCSTEQDWRKLKQVLQYLNHTIDYFLTIGATGLTRMDVYVDAAYGVHMDMKGHTGGCVSLGRGTLMSKLSKQKISMKSSTKTEVVGYSKNYTPNALWGRNFLAHQGYTIELDLHQDNQSAMRMTRNGRKSCGQKSRHMLASRS